MTFVGCINFPLNLLRGPEIGSLKARPVQFGGLPAAAEQLLTKPRSQPKIELNFEALSCCLFKRTSHKMRTNPGVS